MSRSFCSTCVTSLCNCERLHSRPNPKNSGFWHSAHTNGVWSSYCLSKDTGEVLLLLFSLLGQEFYNGVATNLIGKIRKPNTSLLLMI